MESAGGGCSDTEAVSRRFPDRTGLHERAGDAARTKSQEYGFHLLVEIAENRDKQADKLELFDMTV